MHENLSAMLPKREKGKDLSRPGIDVPRLLIVSFQKRLESRVKKIVWKEMKGLEMSRNLDLGEK